MNEQETHNFLADVEQLGARKMALKTGITERSVYRRLAKIRKEFGLRSPIYNYTQGRLEIEIHDGTVLVGSDAHYWPGKPSTAHRAFVKFITDHRPEVVCINGDALDAACISRFPPIGWENLPSVKEELDICQERLEEIVKATIDIDTPPHLIWTLGNHDARFETRLASVAPEFKDVHGVHLKDHFPMWTPCWSLFINGEKGVVIKHRFKGGIHAPHNNVMWAGRSMITGHLHSQKVTPFSDYNGTRWGVDTGTLADPVGPQFTDYTEDGPRNHRSGFALLTFVNGALLPPELITVWDTDHVTFRGEIIHV